MSLGTERDEDTDVSVLDHVEDWYHIPVLLTVLLGMLAIRMQSYSNFIRNGEVLFSGNDAWYHLRAVNYTVRHWPFTIPFDPWTNFPRGTSIGQFGTLYDQIIATVALIVGLGSPSDQLVAKTLLVAPAVFGALTAIPVYLLGKRLAGRLPGLFGAVMLMLLPGVFLQRTLVGVSDHNGAEPLFQAFAVLGLVVAFGVAEREKPVWELVTARDFEALRRPLTWATLAGVAVALYMWVWPPGVLLVGIVGVFVVLKAASDAVNGESPEPVAFAGAVAMTVTAALMAVQIDALAFSPTQFSLLQPLLSLAVALGCLFLAALARGFESADASPALYPVAVFGAIGLSLAALAVGAPDVFGLIRQNLLRIVGFSANAATRTIGEAQPFLDPTSLRQYGVDATGRIIIEYGFALFTAIVAAAWMLTKPLVATGDVRRYGYAVGGFALVGLLFLAPGALDAVASTLGSDPQILGLLIVAAVVTGAALLAPQRSEILFVVLWAGFVTAAAFTQVRFNYYLAVVVAVFNAYLLGEMLSLIGLRASSVGAALQNVERYQLIAVFAAVLLVLAPALVVPINVGQGQSAASTSTAWQTGSNIGPGAVSNWDGTLAWLQNETPEEGNFGGANNADSFDYYEKFSKPSDGDFDYPAGTYGVLSWWDYGHWITTQGHRIPNANPFQQGAVTAANFLLAPSEDRAQSVLSRQGDESERTKYVMVDWKMAAPTEKFGAPVVFYDDGDVTQQEFYSYLYDGQTGRFQTTVKHQRYYESMMVRLYQYHGSAMSPQPFVVDWDTVTYNGVSYKVLPRGEESAVKTFDNMSAARDYVERDGTSQVGGLGPYPSREVEALQHYRLVKMSESSATSSSSYLRSMLSTTRSTGFPQQYLERTNPAWVKTFEKVDGAKVRGSGAPANATVTASVEMRSPTTNTTFTYVQRAETNAQGEFEMTLPYSTTGYGQFGPEKNGRTNVSVRATGPYTFSTDVQTAANGSEVVYSANQSVSEAKVVGADDAPVRVELDERPAPENASDGATGQTPTVGDAGSGNATDGGSPGANGSNGSDANASALVAPAAAAVERAAVAAFGAATGLAATVSA